MTRAWTDLPFLMEAFWKSGAALGAALSLNVFLRKQSADLRRVVLSTAIVALFVAAAAWPVLPRWTAVTLPWLRTQVPVAAPAVEPALSPATPVDAPEPPSLETRGALSSPRPAQMKPDSSLRVPALIPLMWFVGATIFLTRFSLNLRSLRRLRNLSYPVTDPDLLSYVHQSARRIDLLQNETIVAPATWGILQPVILLPAGFEQLPPECRNAVLCHELAHIQAHDFLLRILSEIARAALWFQPLMWIARRQLREEQELACDDRVLAAGGKPSEYAKLLMDWDARLRGREVLIAAGIAQGSCLTRRLYALLNQDLRRDPVSRPATLATGFLALATALPLIAVSFTPPIPSVVPPPHTRTAAVERPMHTPAPVQMAQLPPAQQRQPAVGTPKSPAALIVLVLDKSASMEGLKIEMLRAAATAVIDTLRPQDQIGILTFDRSFQWTVPIRRADDKASLKQSIAGIYAEGGTLIPTALREAYEKALPDDAPFRHIVLLTDGISEELDSEQIAKDASDHKITISTIGLGQDVKRPFLEKIAAAAGGKSYFLSDPNGLEQTMLRDVKDFSGTASIVTTPRLEFASVSLKLYPLAPNAGIHRTYNGRPAPRRAPGNRYMDRHAKLLDLITEAYGVYAYQVSGLPQLAARDTGSMRYDIDATIPGEAPATPARLQQMLQSLLADRFQLRLHRETKDVPVYALVIGKGGSKLRELRDDEEESRDFGPLEKFRFSEFVDYMELVADRPVIDETGFAGKRYESATPEEVQINQLRRQGTAEAEAAISAALEDKMGLKLEPRTERMEILVIDHVGDPTPD